MMTVIFELAYKLGILISISLVAGFIGFNRRESRWKVLLQGLFFGLAAIVGILNPVEIGEGLLFDGRAIIISIAGFYFGPTVAFITALLSAVTRVYVGGEGTITGLLIILTAFLIGCLFHYRVYNKKSRVSIKQLYGMGLFVHVISVLLLMTIPDGHGREAIRVVGIPVLIVFPIATAFLGYIISSIEKLNHTLSELEIKQKEFVANEKHHRAIIGAITDLVYTLDADGRYIDYEWSGEESAFTPPQDFLGKLQTEVLTPEVARLSQEKLKLALETNKVQTIEYELYHGDIKRYYKASFIKSTDQKVVKVIRNITERKKAEEDLRNSEYNFKMIYENSADAILLIEDGRFVDCNQSALNLFDAKSKKEIVGKSPSELSPEYQPDGQMSKFYAGELLDQCVTNGKVQFEWVHQNDTGKIIPVEVMLTRLSINDKVVIHVLARDTQARKALENKYAYLSTHDQLTGLYNRYYLNTALKHLESAENLPLTIVMADLNGLKLVNDSFGHLVGDQLLVKVAEIIGKVARPEDICCRIGGDEFLIIMPRTDSDEAEKLVDEMKKITTEEYVGAIDLSISFGWEVKQSEEEDVQEILKMAEDYMYKKKLHESPSMRGKTIKAITKTLHEKNKREEQHSHRVSYLCYQIGAALGLSDDDRNDLKTVGLLHDIGKIAIDEKILNKPGKLTANERKEIERHPEISYRILSTVNELAEMAEYVLAHHERWDGKGYPKGMKGEEIPYIARIICIVDAYDAMTSDRPYRKALSHEFAIEELRKNAGIQFDPALVEVFINSME